MIFGQAMISIIRSKALDLRYVQKHAMRFWTDYFFLTINSMILKSPKTAAAIREVERQIKRRGARNQSPQRIYRYSISMRT